MSEAEKIRNVHPFLQTDTIIRVCLRFVFFKLILFQIVWSKYTEIAGATLKISPSVEGNANDIFLFFDFILESSAEICHILSSSEKWLLRLHLHQNEHCHRYLSQIILFSICIQ